MPIFIYYMSPKNMIFAIFRSIRNWKADIKTADLNETHLIHMGDMLTDGIVKQFPEKFK